MRTPVERDSAAALYARLVDAPVSRIRLAFLARSLGEREAYLAHLDEAVAAGERQACFFRVRFTGEDHDLSTPAGLGRYVDAVEACPRRADGPDLAAETLQTLARQIEAGNAAAAAFLNALRAEGIFERHPRLADLIAEA